MATVMDERPYDISHLLDKAAALPDAAPKRVSRGIARHPVRRDAEAMQEALAHELLQARAAHEELIRQYLRLHDPVDDDG